MKLFYKFLSNILNSEAKKRNSKPEDIIRALEIKSGEVIADIGAGGGYFALRFSKLTGEEGLVYAVDVKPRLLKIIEMSVEEQEISNVKTVLANPEDKSLPLKDVDLFFLRNVYHHLKNRVEYFTELKSALKPGGKVAIIDYTREKRFHLAAALGHQTPKGKIITR